MRTRSNRRGKRGAEVVKNPLPNLGMEQPARIKFSEEGEPIRWDCSNSCSKQLAHILEGRVSLENFVWSRKEGLFLVPRDSVARVPIYQKIARHQAQSAADLERLGEAGITRAALQRAASRQRENASSEISLSELPKRIKCPKCDRVSILVNIRRKEPEQLETGHCEAPDARTAREGLTSPP